MNYFSESAGGRRRQPNTGEWFRVILSHYLAKHLRSQARDGAFSRNLADKLSMADIV